MFYSDNGAKLSKQIDEYSKLRRKDKAKVNIPWHVRAAISYNKLRKINHDNYSSEIIDGSKVLVCTLKNNPMGISRVAMPIDLDHIPAWFKNLPFDDAAMENTIIDKKLNNLVGVLDWDLAQTKEISDNQLFSFGTN